jgi:hypothetical protein
LEKRLNERAETLSSQSAMTIGISFYGKSNQRNFEVFNSVKRRARTSYIPPSGSTSVSSSQPTIPLVIDWHTNPRVPAAGKVIVIEDATHTSLVYRIE